MNNKAIGLIDSGIGGFTVLKELQRYFPNENFTYFGDSKNMPYGEKTNDEIISLVNQAIKFLTQKGVKFIILACNTASSLIDYLNSDVKLFNIIEAGCQAALKLPEEKEIGLIATRATVKNQTYDKILEQFTQDQKFISFGTQNLARVINNQLDEIALLKENIHLAIEPILAKAKINYLILGCTHFPIVSKTINELYPDISLIDPAKTEAKIVEQFLNDNHLRNTSDKLGKTLIYITDDGNDLINQRLLNELEINYEELNYI